MEIIGTISINLSQIQCMTRHAVPFLFQIHTKSKNFIEFEID